LGCQVSPEVSNSCHVSAFSACRINPPASCRLLSPSDNPHPSIRPFHKPSSSSKHLKLAAQTGSVWRLIRMHTTYTRISYVVKFRLKGPKNILRVYFCTVLVCARDKQTLFKMTSPHQIVFLNFRRLMSTIVDVTHC